MGGVESAEELVDVAIIGNGPSALALSTALAGLVPEVRARALQDPVVSALAQRLDGMALDSLPEAAVPRRCLNPMAALVDALRFPEGDGRGQSLLRYGRLKRPMTHTVIGWGSETCFRTELQ